MLEEHELLKLLSSEYPEAKNKLLLYSSNGPTGKPGFLWSGYYYTADSYITDCKFYLINNSNTTFTLNTPGGDQENYLEKIYPYDSFLVSLGLEYYKAPDFQAYISFKRGSERYSVPSEFLNIESEKQMFDVTGINPDNFNVGISMFYLIMENLILKKQI